MSVYKYCVEMASLDMEMMNCVWEKGEGRTSSIANGVVLHM